MKLRRKFQVSTIPNKDSVKIRRIGLKKKEEKKKKKKSRNNNNNNNNKKKIQKAIPRESSIFDEDSKNKTIPEWYYVSTEGLF